MVIAKETNTLVEAKTMQAFSPDDTGQPPIEDPQQKVLHNALLRFCDKVEQDNHTEDADSGLTVREVIWRYGGLRFRARLATVEGQFSSGEYFFSEAGADKWTRLPTPRALAEKLTEAKAPKEK